MDGSRRPPTARAMKEQLVEALSRDGEEMCEICVDVTTYNGQVLDDEPSDSPACRGSAPSRRGSRSRQPAFATNPSAAAAAAAAAGSYSSYSSRLDCSSLVGVSINQQFDVSGSTSPRWFRGQVVEYSAATETYVVRYEDDEQHSLTHAEVLEHLEEPGEAGESRWLQIPPIGAAYRACNSLRLVAAATGCDFNALRKINAKHFPDCDFSISHKFKPKTMIQVSVITTASLRIMCASHLTTVRLWLSRTASD
jgi:hypothetical protein